MTFPQRLIGAAKLDVPAFEEIEANRHATGQALLVVVLSSAAGGIGLTSNLGEAPVVQRILLALLLWIFWAAATYAIGHYVMPEPQTRTDVGELLRTIGFAASPGVLRVFGFVPGVGLIIYGVASAWMLVAMIVAVRQALDYTSTIRAAVVCLIASIIAIALTVVAGGLFLMLVEEVVS